MRIKSELYRLNHDSYKTSHSDLLSVLIKFDGRGDLLALTSYKTPSHPKRYAA
jgi:hypothetical protein